MPKDDVDGETQVSTPGVGDGQGSAWCGDEAAIHLSGDGDKTSRKIRLEPIMAPVTVVFQMGVWLLMGLTP